jgi:dihydroorotase
MASVDRFVLKGAHVIDPAQGIDGISDVVVSGGKIESVGVAEITPATTMVDLSGHYLSPGWIDLHVHAYGTLGFADPDSLGVYQGVTTFVEAGGPGIGTIDEFLALMTGLETSLYVGPFIRPMGLLGLNYIEGDVRSLGEVPITRWVDFAKEHKDVLRYLKCNAIGDYGPGTLKITKGLADILNLPLYMHIGEFQMQTPEHLLAPEAFKVAEKGDMITHLYHGNLGQVIGDDGKVLGVVRDAQRRGVLFDIGFGGYNFSWDVAEKAWAQDLVPYTISSDLQQFNVVRPTKSLANVMTVMMRLGMTLQQVIERVTCNPAQALSLSDRAGSLKPGLPADITIFRVDAGEVELSDCYTKSRKAEQRITPIAAFKNGRRFDVDLGRSQDESNWFMQVAEEHIPAAASRFTAQEKAFLGSMASALARTEWSLGSGERLQIEKALELQDLFHRVRREHDLSLRSALLAVYDCFIEKRFTMQIGLFLMRLEKPFALSRLQEVIGARLPSHERAPAVAGSLA